MRPVTRYPIDRDANRLVDWSVNVAGGMPKAPGSPPGGKLGPIGTRVRFWLNETNSSCWTNDCLADSTVLPVPTVELYQKSEVTRSNGPTQRAVSRPAYASVSVLNASK